MDFGNVCQNSSGFLNKVVGTLRRTVTWKCNLNVKSRNGKMKSYNVGILGNCCTHGAGICNMFKSRSDTRVIAAYESNPRRAKELQGVFGAPLSTSYEAVINHPEVDFVAVTCDPCDKAEMVERAAAVGKHIFLNKPLCESLNSARRIAAAVETHNVHFVHDIPMVRFIPVYARLLEEVQAGVHGEGDGLSSSLRDEFSDRF